MDNFSNIASRFGINTVKSIVTLDYLKVTEDRLISEVYEEFGQSFKYVYVINADGLLVGLLDQVKMIQTEVHKTIKKPVRDLICEVPICLASNMSIKEALSFFIKQKVNEIPVTDEAGRMIGVLKLWSLLDYHERKLEQLDQELDNSKRLTATLEAVIENPYEGMVVVDESSHVIMINNFYLEVLGLTKEQALGKHIIDLTPHSKLPDIVRTGVAQFAEHWKVQGRDYLIIRAPIMRDGKTIGAIGKTLFKDMGLAHVFARKLTQLEEDLKFYKEELSKIHRAAYTFDDIIGQGPKITSTVSLARRAARTASTVLLTGESGTGKELFAHAIHNDSVRRHGPFIKVDCVAIPEQLLESELFGYAEGAFTGARKGGKPGKFELANHGTIFLDEIGDMSLTMQAKLLRVIQEREIERVGATQPFKVDLRIIAASNRKLYAMVQEGTFREDLFYRLNVMVLELPSLRERPEDIEILANYLVTKLNQKLETYVEGISREAIQLLQSYSWPGNVRELESVLERTMNIYDNPIILPEHLPAQLRHSIVGTTKHLDGDKKMLEVGLNSAEKDLLLEALRRAEGNKAKAAEILGIHRSALYKKLAKHGLKGGNLSYE